MSLMRAIATVSGFTLLSRIAGFARDILMAAILGAGPIADAFFVALKLPNLFRRLFAEGAFSVSFVPLFASELEANGRQSALDFASRTNAILSCVLIPFSALALIFMPQIMAIIAPGFKNDPEKFSLAVHYSTITFPYLFFISLTALYGGILNAFDRFAPFAFAPVLFNLCLISGLAYSHFGQIEAGLSLSYAVLSAGILQFGFLFLSAYRAGIRLHWRKPKLSPRIKRLFRLMAPGAIGAGVSQINLFIDIILASMVADGAVSYLYYADRLYQLPLGVIGIAIGTALLPVLARSVQANDLTTAHHYQNRGLETGLLLTLPAAVALFVLASPLLHILFERGAFGAEETKQTAKALMAYACGLPAFVLIKIFATAFFARQDTKTPVIIAVIVTLINIALSLYLIQYLGHIGIALATAITAWINLLILAILLSRKSGLHFDKQLLLRVPLIAVCAVLMGGALSQSLPYISDFIYHETLPFRILGLSLLVGGGGLLYFSLCFCVGALKKQDFIRMVRKQATPK